MDSCIIETEFVYPMMMSLRNKFLKRHIVDPFLCILVARNVSGFKDFILVVQNEERCFIICDQMYGVSESESGTSSSFGIVATYYNTRVEMGPNHNGFYGRVTINREKA